MTPRASGGGGHPAPDQVRVAVERLGLATTITARPLAGGRGGRTWRIDADHGSYVLHQRAGHGTAVGAARIRRESRATSLAHAAGVGPEVVATDEDGAALLTRWIPGRALSTPRLADPVVLVQLADCLRQLHRGSLPRHQLRPERDRRRYLRLVPLDADPALRAALASTQEPLDELANLLAASVPHDVLVHGDLVPGNVIIGARCTSLVDYEYSGRADAAFDLGNLVASASLNRAGLRRLVTAYARDANGVAASARDQQRLERRVRAWARVAQGSWIAWVAVGEDLGPHAAQWRAWARRASADLIAAQRRSEIASLTRDVQDSASEVR